MPRKGLPPRGPTATGQSRTTLSIEKHRRNTAPPSSQGTQAPASQSEGCEEGQRKSADGEGLVFHSNSQSDFLLQCLGKVSRPALPAPMAGRKNTTSDSLQHQERAAQGAPHANWLLKNLLQEQERPYSEACVTRACSGCWQQGTVATL